LNAPPSRNKKKRLRALRAGGKRNLLKERMSADFGHLALRKNPLLRAGEGEPKSGVGISFAVWGGKKAAAVHQRGEKRKKNNSPGGRHDEHQPRRKKNRNTK